MTGDSPDIRRLTACQVTACHRMITTSRITRIHSLRRISVVRVMYIQGVGFPFWIAASDLCWVLCPAYSKKKMQGRNYIAWSRLQKRGSARALDASRQDIPYAASDGDKSLDGIRVEVDGVVDNTIKDAEDDITARDDVVAAATSSAPYDSNSSGHLEVTRSGSGSSQVALQVEEFATLCENPLLLWDEPSDLCDPEMMDITRLRGTLRDFVSHYEAEPVKQPAGFGGTK
jgi:hypothetical protein